MDFCEKKSYFAITISTIKHFIVIITTAHSLLRNDSLKKILTKLRDKDRESGLVYVWCTFTGAGDRNYESHHEIYESLHPPAAPRHRHQQCSLQLLKKKKRKKNNLVSFCSRKEIVLSCSSHHTKSDCDGDVDTGNPHPPP